MKINKTSIKEIDELVMLFDQYMVFYKQDSAPEKYRTYLTERLNNNEATVFIAYNENGNAMGFALNYYSFSSVSLSKKVVLNDLFVMSEYRNKGVAKQLIDSCVSLAKELDAIRIDLSTAKDNFIAQALYEKIGFIQDVEYFSYSLPINNKC